MFGKLMKAAAGNDPAKQKALNDQAERLAGVDLDGDGTIGGVPVKKPAPATTPAPQQPAAQPTRTAAPAAQPAAQPSQGINVQQLLGAGQAILTKSGKIKPAPGAEGGFGALLGAFKSFSPEVQNKAETQAMKLDDGRDLPLSTLTGRRRALLIGINYIGTANQLRGCINDVKNVQRLITTKFNFPSTPDAMRVLTDDSSDPSLRPTKANILEGMRWLIQGAQSGDSLFIHYSGHGATSKDTSPDTDEADGQDETLVPVDYQSAGMIVDDVIFDTLVAPLPKGVRLTAVMDCCHSGSVFDLPYSYVLDQGRDLPVEVDNRKVAIAAALAAGKALMAKDYGGAFKSLMEAGKAYMAMQAQGQGGQGGGGGGGAAAAAPAEPTFQTPASSNTSSSYNSSYTPPADNTSSYNSNTSAPAASSSSSAKLGSVSTDQNVSAGYISVRTALADVIQFSGCRDEQTSADAFIGGEATGAMSYALIKAFEDFGVNQTYAELLRNIRTTLYGKYKQIPQMSTGHRMMDLDSKFGM